MSTFPTNLFKDETSKSSFAGAPKLVPNTDGFAGSEQSSNSDPTRGVAAWKAGVKTSTGVVNVHGLYPWTITDDARAYVPKLRLIEYRLTQASELNGAYQTFRGVKENAGFASDLATRAIIDKITNALSLNAAPNVKTDLETALRTDNNNSGIDISPNRDDILSNIGTEYMNVYKGLYTVQPTNWEYVLPYLGASNMMTNTNTFSDYNFQARFVNPIENAVRSFPRSTNPEDKSSRRGGGSIFKWLQSAGEATNVFISGEAGAIKAEAPQSFTGATKENLQVTFYLLNTISPEHIRKNWEFCYLFSYQNLPNRRSINLLDAPRIYTAQILGYKTMPACYISDLKIENVGAVRMIDIGSTSIKQNATNTVQNTFVNGSETMRMIPEAYKISFTLQSVFINSQNLFRLTLEPSGGIITTSTVLTPGKAAGPNQTVVGRNSLTGLEASKAFNQTGFSMGSSSPGGSVVPAGGFGFFGPK